MKKYILVLLMIVSPLMAQEKTEAEVTKKGNIRSIVSFNFGVGGTFYDGDSSNYLSSEFQMLSSIEYILGKNRFHWYSSTGVVYFPNTRDTLFLTTGLGMNIFDYRNAEGLGWSMDWNIVAVGLAVQENERFGVAGVTSLRARYTVTPKFAIQFGLDYQEFIMFSSSEYDGLRYFGASIGLAFGR